MDLGKKQSVQNNATGFVQCAKCILDRSRKRANTQGRISLFAQMTVSLFVALRIPTSGESSNSATA
jgi:hypothetical protein